MTAPGTGTLGRAVPVAAGLAIQAITAYLTLIVAGRVLGAAEFGKLAALYTVISSVANGLYQPLEQEVSRRRGREWETGRAEAALLRRALLFATCLSLLVIALGLGLHDMAVRLLGGDPQLLAALCVGLPGYALCFVSRGALSGARRLRRYGLQLAVEGVFRLVGVVGLALLAVHTVPWYGWLFGLAPWLALAVSSVGLRPAANHPVASATPLVTPLLLLLVSALATQLLIGAGPVVAQLFAGAADQAQIGAFLAALVVVRLPVLLFTAIQPSVLPALSAHVAAGRAAAFRALLVKVLAALAALALLTTAATAGLGPWALRLLFGSDYVLSRGVFALMGASVGTYVIATGLSLVPLAYGRHRLVALGWLTGLAGLAAGTGLAHDPVLRATMGLLIGAAAATVVFALVSWRAMTRRTGVVEGAEQPPPTTAELTGAGPV
ncbi:hypothetical protein Drose_17390 [Dactylosporangium roseum]|uniref:Polysaccharide biosynthesis protein n=1 Tax=Dactylosporangium roseum TaxID=47989 RepID=A0ABY5ZCH6_9ACTN|nr:hypothetical protein [Dactylosporangium roseum]UWZ39831.1 hypothetical protein Drose_17390 [Dactylosporangium roseum]